MQRHQFGKQKYERKTKKYNLLPRHLKFEGYGVEKEYSHPITFTVDILEEIHYLYNDVLEGL